MRIARAGLVVLLSVVLVISGVQPATAATATGPAPVNVLPSVVTAAAGNSVVGAAAADQVKETLYQYAIREPETVEAFRRRAQGVATEADWDRISLRTKDYNLPAAAPKVISKAGAAGAAMTGVGLGLMVGTEGSRLFGLDPEGTFCVSNPNGGFFGDSLDGFMQLVGAVDCSMVPAEDYLPNIDQPVSIDYASVDLCMESGCVTLSKWKDLGRGDYAACSTISGTVPIRGGKVVAIEFKMSDGRWGDAGDWDLDGRCSNGYLPTFMTPGRVVRLKGATGADADGKVMEPVEKRADPERSWTTEVVGSDGNTYRCESERFRESEAEWVQPCMPDMPPGVSPEEVRILQGGPGMDPETVMEQQTTDEFQHLKNELADCMDGSCILDLRQKQSGVSCFELDTACADWAESPQSINEYACYFGPHSVSISECYIYLSSFKPESKVTGDTISDPEPELKPDGTPVPKPIRNPGPGPANSLDPGTSPGTSANPQRCMDEWLDDFNPLDWVFVPVKCALVWAFVPRAVVVEQQLATLEDAWTDTGIGKLSNAVTAWEFTAPGNGCGGVAVPLGSVYGHGVENVQILAACPGDPLRGTAQLSSVVIGIAAVLGAVWSVTRSFGGVVGFTGLGGNGGGTP